ncbi:MAG: prolipoprotein diacylglyceryl transferase family protein [Microgenomates group bacterium]
MLPILLSLGPIKIYSYGVFLAIGLFISLYFWWKMGRDEHFDEISLFDGYFLSILTYFVVGRLGYVLLHTAQVGTLYRALAILSFPGIESGIGILGAIVFIILFARNNDWDPWKVMDAFVVALSMALVFGGIGGLLNGSNPGIAASWGVIPVDAVTILWALITFAVVSRVRKNFRFYAWYKGESSMAREGLASLIFGIATGIYFMITGWILQEPWVKLFKVIPLEFILGLTIIAVCGYLIEKRVGRRDGSLWGKLKELIRRK